MVIKVCYSKSVSLLIDQKLDLKSTNYHLNRYEKFHDKIPATINIGKENWPTVHNSVIFLTFVQKRFIMLILTSKSCQEKFYHYH